MPDEPLTFPDGPRSDLDSTLARLVQDAQQVLATQERLRTLLRATRAVAEEIELSVVLRRIIEVAVDLVGARYGAIGVIGPDGHHEQFIHVGMDEEQVRKVGDLPRGRGILGAVIEEQEPIRLEHLKGDSRSSGFPKHHPPMDSFLGVPVRVRDEVFGNLYLTDHESGPFTAEDQELLVALAATAGVAIEHARLYEETRRRQRWAETSAEISATLLSEQAEDALEVLVERVAILAEADLVCVVVPVGEGLLRVDLCRGDLAAEAEGLIFEGAGTVPGRAIEGRQPILAEHPGVEVAGLGPTMAVPFPTHDELMGTLVVLRRAGRPRFSESELVMTADIAAQAAVAIALAAAQNNAHRLAVLEDRGRIARDLHDHVIQRLFGAGLSLQAISGGADAATAARLMEQVDTLDAAIAEIRTAIFAMTARSDAEPSLRHRVLDIVTESAEALPAPPRLVFSGPVDLLVPPEVVEDVVAVVREGLANIARHARASSSVVSVTVSDSRLTIEIVDDGVGIPAGRTRSSGTANLDARATARGGSFDVRPRDPSGTLLEWSVPLER